MLTENTLLFTVGPVMMDEEILEISKLQTPYFRTKEFSEYMFSIEKKLIKMLEASDKTKIVILTASGSGAMEAAVINLFDENSKVLVINGGSFGHRFEQICQIHNIWHETLNLLPGENLKKEDLMSFSNKGFTGILINVHETSTGVLYDMEMVGEFAKKEKMIVVADSISSFLADDYKMKEWGINVTILSSQKAIALDPGISIIAIDEEAAKIIKKNQVKSLYFDLKDCLANMERGQTPFTPAVGIIMQLGKKLEMIEELGIEAEKEKVKIIAEDFREKIKNLPIELFSKKMSNSVTAIKTKNISAYKVYEKLRYEYNITVLPSGGELKNVLFRVGHIGNLKKEDNTVLVNALKNILSEGN